MKRLAVYCGSATPADPRYVELAREVGETLAKRGIGVVYGGGKLGLMGAVASGALAAGGEVIGVIPEALRDKEIAHPHLTKLHVVGSMHERKQMMADLSTGFVALPGGLGTLEELFEIWTWAQLGYHKKPVGLLDVANFYEKLDAFLDHTVEAGFVRAEHRDMLALADRRLGRDLDEVG